MIKYEIKMSPGLNLKPAELSRRLKGNAVIALNATMKQAHNLARGPIPDGASGIKRAIKLNRATINTSAATVSTSHPLTVFTQENTRPHIIEAKKKALAFKVKGKLIFARRVKHPGTKGTHSFVRASAYVERHLQLEVGKAIDAALNGKPYSPLSASLNTALSSLLK